MAVIPRLQRQQGLPTSTGMRSLPGVQLSNDLAEAGANLSNATLKIGDEMMRAQQADEINTATVNSQLKLAALETEVSTMDGPQAMAYYTTQAQNIYAENSAIITHPRAREKFDRDWGTLSVQSQIKVQSAATTRKKDQAAGNLTMSLDALSKGIDPSGSSVGRIMAEGTAQRLIDEAVNAGVITAKDGATRILKFRGDQAKSGLNQVIRQTDGTTDLEALHDDMATDSFDPNSDIGKMWAQLDDTERLAMQSKVRTKHERRLNIAEKREKDSEAQRKRSENREFAKFKKRIIQSRQDETGNTPIPTLDEIVTALGENRISADQYANLEAAIKNPAATTDNTNVKLDFYRRIYAAKNKKEIDAIIEDSYTAVTQDRSITPETQQILEQRALARVSRTPEERRKERYTKALDKVLKSTDFLDQILPGAKERAAFVMLDFQTRLEDGEDPATAFADALEDFNTRGAVELNSIPTPEFGPNKPLREWSIQDVEKAQERTEMEFRGKPDRLALQILILNSLAAYLKSTQEAGGSAEKTQKELEEDAKRLRDGN